MAKRNNNNSDVRRTYGGQPYDINNSFVKKMATKVTDLIPQRSWISKWFNSPGGDGDISNIGDNIEEQDMEEEILQPPSKRPRIRMDMTHPAGTFAIQSRNRISNENHESSSKPYFFKNEMLEDFLPTSEKIGSSSTRSFASSTPAINMQFRNVNTSKTDTNTIAQKPLSTQSQQQNHNISNGTEDNSESSESTSGCSNLIPQMSRQELFSTYVNLPFGNRKNLVNDKLTYPNHLQSSRSLIIDGRDSMNSRKPSFNASVMSNDANSIEQTKALSSPFYSGNTTFGGANALSNFQHGRGHTSSINEFQLKVPRRTSIRVKPSNVPAQVSDSSGMSQTAKRILEALEHFSSPLTDAKKIPVKSPINVSSVGKKRAREEYIGPISRVGLRHLTRELAVPTVPDMLKLKRRQRLQDTTLAARKIVSAHNGPPPIKNSNSTCSTSDSYYIRGENDSSKFFGKLRAKSKKKNNSDIEQPAETVNLSGIPLPITNLPVFDIPLPISNGKITTVDIPQTVSKTKSPIKHQENYKFASPIKICSASKTLKSINDFTFSKPINADCDKGHIIDNSSITPISVNSSHLNSTTSQPMTNFVWSGSSTAPRPKEKKRQTENKEMSAETKVAMKLKSGSVMDILGKKTDNTEANIWECSECLIKNNPNEEQCAACKARKPNSIENNPSTSMMDYNITSSIGGNDTQFGAKFKMTHDKWECNSCLVRNAQSQIKCVSCMAPKHEISRKEDKSSSSVTFATTKVDVMEKFRSPVGSWECPGCMLKNPSDVIACPCCNASKPGLVNVDLKPSAESKKKSVESKILTNLTSAMKKQNSWECPTCMVTNNITALTCVCCATSCPKDKTTLLSSSSSSSSSSSTSSSSSSASSSSSSSSSSTNELTHIENTSKIASGFGDKFKKPEGAWSCDICMVQNQAVSVECVACGGLKPGEIKPKNETSTAVNSASPFNFGTTSNTSQFKFGVTKSTENQSTSKSNGFTFGIPTTQQSIQTFTFGIPNAEKCSKAPEAKIGLSNNVEGKADQVKHKSDVAETKKSTSGENSSTDFIFGASKTDEKSLKTNDTTKRSNPFIFNTSATQLIDDKSEKAILNDAKNNLNNSLNNNQQVISVDKSVDANKYTTTSFSFVAPTSTGITATDSGSALSTSTAASSIIGQTPFTFSVPKSSSPECSSIPNFDKTPSSVTSETTSSSSFSIKNSKFSKVVQANSDENKSAITSFGDTSRSSSAFGHSNLAAVTSAIGQATETKAAISQFTPSNNENKKPIGFKIDEKPQTFGSIESKTLAFGDANMCKSSNDNLVAFGGNENGISNTASSSFGTLPASIPVQSPAPTQFGSQSSVSSIFGSGNNSSFGTQQQQQSQSAPQNIFSTVKTADNNNQSGTSSLFTFGAASPQQPTSQTSSDTFNFIGSHDATNSANSKPIFNFGSNTNTIAPCQPIATVTNFGATNFATLTPSNPPSPATRFSFNTPKGDGPPAFGQTSATAMPNIFGNGRSSSTLGQSTPATSFAGTSSGFSFGTPAPVSGSASSTVSSGFNFPAGTVPATPSGGFNFTAINPPSAIAFDPNTRPTFNFTGGSAPTMFNATPQPVGGRKIKKAVRRIPPRT